MDINSVGSNYSDIANMLGSQKAEEPSDVEAQYAVKLIKMMQESTQVVGSILEDTAEISKEAMQKLLI